jgi:hypothetical protein
MTYVCRIAVEIAEHRDHRLKLADSAALYQFPHPQPLRMRLYHKSFADFHAGAISRTQQFLRFRCIARDWLFA